MDLRKNLEAILFDLDGTLFGLDVDWPKIRQYLQGLVQDDQENSISKLVSLLPDSQKNAAHHFISQEEIAGVQHGHILPGSKEVLKSLANKYKVAVVSRNSRLSIKLALQLMGAPENIVVVGREDVTMQKPDPSGILLAVKLMGVSLENVVFVGDTFHDVEAAEAAGLKCIIVNNPQNAYRPKGADKYIDSLDDLTRALS